MPEEKRKSPDEVISEIVGRLKARRCRGIKVNQAGGVYKLPEKILFESSGSEGRIPDITTEIPDLIIEVEDSESIEKPETLDYCKQLSIHARNKYKTFILVLPLSCAEAARVKMQELKIRNVNYIWY